MNKGILFLLFFFILIIGVGVFLYLKVEKPAQEGTKIEYYNISLKSLDKDTQAQLITRFDVMLDSSTEIYYSSNTTSENYIFIQIPKNRTFSIYAYNSSYYTGVFTNYDLNKEILRVEIPLTKLGSFNLTQSATFGKDNPVYVNVLSNGTIQGLAACFRWSPKIISVYIKGYDSIAIPARLKDKVDKCFDLKRTIENEEYIIQVSYQRFGILDSSDYINTIVLDSDYRYYSKGLLLEDSNFNDIGVKDVQYNIKNI